MMSYCRTQYTDKANVQTNIFQSVNPCLWTINWPTLSTREKELYEHIHLLVVHHMKIPHLHYLFFSLIDIRKLINQLKATMQYLTWISSSIKTSKPLWIFLTINHVCFISAPPPFKWNCLHEYLMQDLIIFHNSIRAVPSNVCVCVCGGGVPLKLAEPSSPL